MRDFSLVPMYADYKLEYVIDYINNAKSKRDLYDAVAGICFFDIVNREDIIDAFNKKANEFGIDEDKLFEWSES